MTLRDRSCIPPLSAGDYAALDLLVEDRDSDELTYGVTRGALERAGCTRWVASMIDRFRAHGYSVGGAANGRYQLGPGEPMSTETPDGGRTDVLDAPVRPSGVSVDLGPPRLFDVPREHHYRAEAA